MKRTFCFKNKPTIIATSSIAGPKESAGWLNKYIQTKLDDDMYDEQTFEKAESRMLYTVIKNSIVCPQICRSKISSSKGRCNNLI